MSLLAMLIRFFVIWFVFSIITAIIYNLIKRAYIMTHGYHDLTEIISFAGFDFSNYYEDEKNVLQPRLEEAGYTDISWGMGEADSFGPLSRVCQARARSGEFEYFVYG